MQGNGTPRPEPGHPSQTTLSWPQLQDARRDVIARLYIRSRRDPLRPERPVANPRMRNGGRLKARTLSTCVA